MNASELNRKLIYCGYNDMVDYLEDSPVNRYLYEWLLKLMPFEIEIPAVKIFNEIYYQCARISLDSHPGENLGKRYLEESTAWLGSCRATAFVFSVVMSFLLRKKSLTIQEECFMRQLGSQVDTSYCSRNIKKALMGKSDSPLVNISISLRTFFMVLNYSKDSVLHYSKDSPKDLPPNAFYTMPCPVEDIPEFLLYNRITKKPSYFKLFFRVINYILGNRSYILGGESEFFTPWSEITENFSYKIMEGYIKLYTTIEDQKILLERIETGCLDRFSNEEHENNFAKLRKLVSDGEFCSSVGREGEKCHEVETNQLEFSSSEVEKLKNALLQQEPVDAVTEEFTSKSQTFVFNMPNVQQFNNNPKTVINRVGDKDENEGKNSLKK